MRKTITINGTAVEFKSSAAIPRMYRLKFGHDIFVDMNRLKKQVDAQNRAKQAAKKEAEKNGEEFDEESFESSLPIDSLEMFENIAFIMSKHADPEQPSEIEDWLDQFETFDIYQVLPEILEMWNLENETRSKQKKGPGK